MKDYYVYILASKSKVLYCGVTSNLEQRIFDQKSGTYEGFTKRYNVHRLVYVDTYPHIYDAIAREKQIKGWTRQKKLDLITAENPTWADLSEDWR